MEQLRLTDSQILAVLKQNEAGRFVPSGIVSTASARRFPTAEVSPVGRLAQQVRRHRCVTDAPVQLAAGREPTHA